MMIDRMLFNFYLTTEFKEWKVCTITLIITQAYRRLYLLKLLELHEHFVIQPIIRIWCLQNPGAEFSRCHIRPGRVTAILRELYILSQPTVICMSVINGCGICFGFPYLMICGNQRSRKASGPLFWIGFFKIRLSPFDRKYLRMLRLTNNLHLIYIGLCTFKI